MRKREVIGPRNLYSAADDSAEKLEVITKVKGLGQTSL